MKTHKIKIAGYDHYLGGHDGTFVNEKCSEDIKEYYLVGEHDSCSCKKCNKAYQNAIQIKKGGGEPPIKQSKETQEAPRQI